MGAQPVELGPEVIEAGEVAQERERRTQGGDANTHDRPRVDRRRRTVRRRGSPDAAGRARAGVARGPLRRGRARGSAQHERHPAERRHDDLRLRLGRSAQQHHPRRRWGAEGPRPTRHGACRASRRRLDRALADRDPGAVPRLPEGVRYHRRPCDRPLRAPPPHGRRWRGRATPAWVGHKTSPSIRYGRAPQTAGVFSRPKWRRRNRRSSVRGHPRPTSGRVRGPGAGRLPAPPVRARRAQPRYRRGQEIRTRPICPGPPKGPAPSPLS